VGLGGLGEDARLCICEILLGCQSLGKLFCETVKEIKINWNFKAKLLSYDCKLDWCEKNCS